jgi:hypothetical protein
MARPTKRNPMSEAAIEAGIRLVAKMLHDKGFSAIK